MFHEVERVQSVADYELSVFKFMLEIYLPSLAILLTLTLALYLLLRRRNGLAVYSLVAALFCCAGSELFDLLAIDNPIDLMSLKKGSLIAESWQPFCFLLFALSFARDSVLRELSWPSRLLLAGTLVLPVVVVFGQPGQLFYSPDFIEERVLFLGSYGCYFYIALMGCLATAMFHLERILMALPRLERLPVQVEIVGAGAIMGMLVVYYSQALLYRSIDMNLVPVRSLVLVIGICMIGVSRLRGSVVTKVRLSRAVAYRSLVLLAVGGYLAGLGLLGEGMRYLDLGMQRTIYFSVAVLSGLAVILVLLSEKLRRKTKVFLHKHFYQYRYDYRKEWRRFTSHLSSARTVDALQQGILSFWCDAFACGVAALYLRDDEQGGYRFAAGYQIDELTKIFAESSPFVSFLADRDWVFNITDDNPQELDGAVQFCQEHGFSLAVPLLFEKSLEGVVFLGRATNPKEQLNYEDFDLMKMLARQATSTLLSVKLSAQLSITRELAAIGKVSAFVMHDLKNLASNLGMVTENAREYLDDPEFQQDMLETLEGTSNRMKALIARLKNVTERKELRLAATDLFEVVEEGLRLAAVDQVTLCGESVPILIDSQEIEKVVHNLVLNACEAGGAPVGIEVGRGDTAFLKVSDRGCGMTEEFIRQNLFQPFQTTKLKGLGIGLYQCKHIVEAHGGRIEVESRVGEGTTFTVLLPLADDQSMVVGNQVAQGV